MGVVTFLMLHFKTMQIEMLKGRGPGINSSQSKNVEKIQLSMQLSHLNIIFENMLMIIINSDFWQASI